MSRRRRSGASIAPTWSRRPKASSAAKTAASSMRFPAAYKDIDAVMANQSDLVEVVHTLKQVLCVKG